jgi:DNA-binding CsgD family transcriptional regulator
MDNALADRIHTLWDELADFNAAQADAALDHLLSALCALVDAQNANWVGAVRMSNILPGDPVNGWRPRCVHYLHPFQPVAANVKEQVRMLEAGIIDITTVKNVSFAGRFRCNRLADLVPQEWFASDYYRMFYRGVDHIDAIWAGCPINEDAEVYFGVFRDVAHGPFSVADRDTVAYALRGLKWFHRRQMLSRGLMVATSPLTAVERKVLEGLLGGLVEKQIAANLGQSHHTTHEYVTNLYRKFGVKNRAALTALWLGKVA